MVYKLGKWMPLHRHCIASPLHCIACLTTHTHKNVPNRVQRKKKKKKNTADTTVPEYVLTYLLPYLS